MSTVAQRAYKEYFGGNEWSPYRHTSSDTVQSSKIDQDIAFIEEELPTKSKYSFTRWAPQGEAMRALEIVERDTQAFAATILYYATQHSDTNGLGFLEYDVSFGTLNPYVLSRAKRAAKRLPHPVLAQQMFTGERQKVADIFQKLAETWKEDTKFTSSLTNIIMHWAYQRIIGLGPEVIPLILRDLEVNGGQWFSALQSLTGENPIGPEDAGRVRRMKEAWLEWGRQKNYIRS